MVTAYAPSMNRLPAAILPGLALACACSAQVVVPANPRKFSSRSIGSGVSPGASVIPKDATTPAAVRHTTHIILYESRIWSSTDGKIIQGKLIAFEDLIVETPQGTAEPEFPPPPAKPTTIRDGKVRISVNQKPFEIPLARLSEADQELILQIQAAIEKKSRKSSTP